MQQTLVSIIISIISVTSTYSQYNLTGVVTDSLQTPLPFTNVLAKPTNPKVEMTFAIADEKGRYKLVLEKDYEYLVSVSFLGFQPYNFKIKLTENKEIPYKL